ncbi:hypothetical protein EJ06DRAFT_270914 [Trichodelitschia bisporula]|uniref:Uncharacterized protein n=1 Tax=Trichodelitschia bisporula TaxID=703511 RepID=A0A6G1HI32_9PEZI|nr:hypothetical protein EJ06DRAFT_270914 [Trichodelitschia bisporula]
MFLNFIGLPASSTGLPASSTGLPASSIFATSVFAVPSLPFRVTRHRVCRHGHGISLVRTIWAKTDLPQAFYVPRLSNLLHHLALGGLAAGWGISSLLCSDHLAFGSPLHISERKPMPDGVDRPVVSTS